MTLHARQRLEERYHMSPKVFYQKYEKAVKEKQYFQIPQDHFRKDYNSISIVINAGNNEIIPLSICKKTGRVTTILAPHRMYNEEARKRGWIK